MKKKMLRMAASSFLYMPPMGMGRLHETQKQTVTSEIRKRHNFISPRGGTFEAITGRRLPGH
jgi:hypothetical protein